jgi:hypothetical protein
MDQIQSISIRGQEIFTHDGYMYMCIFNSYNCVDQNKFGDVGIKIIVLNTNFVEFIHRPKHLS